MKIVLFTKDNEYIQKKIKTKQFELSERILDIRYELGLNFHEMTELLNMKPEEYIDFEYGNTNISVDDYLKVNVFDGNLMEQVS